MPRLAIVTGGGRGIGAEICRVLAQTGFVVVAADIDKDAARATAACLPGTDHLGESADVTDESSVERLFETVERQAGPVAVLVCNAGRLLLRDGKRPYIHETTVENWNEKLGLYPFPFSLVFERGKHFTVLLSKKPVAVAAK